MARLREYFEFLDELRESGAVNMYGAAPVLQQRFGLEKLLARKICQQWREKSAHERAKRA